MTVAELRARVNPKGMTLDSREVEPGDLFVALRGEKADGARFVPEAVRRGAVGILCERLVEGTPLPQAVVPDLRGRLGELAALVYGDPTRELAVVGITGTNGKTTTAHLVEAVLRGAGRNAGCLGTVGYRWNGKETAASHTTPEAPRLQKMFRRMRDEGVTDVVFECSSHALELGRLNGIHFDAAVFTNLTSDHLDFHGTRDRYRAAKERLFRELLPAGGKPGACSVLNADDPTGAEWARTLPGRVLTFSAKGTASDLRVTRATFGLEGFEADVELGGESVPLRSPMPGVHNLPNALGALGAAKALGLDIRAAAAAIASVRSVPGRLERVENDRGLHVFVDYAHTDDALENVLDSLRPHAKRRIVAVFGCGGDRDRTKRPKMAAAVCARADVAILTSDNPRTEDPDRILGEMIAGKPAGIPVVRAEDLSGDVRGVACVLPDRKAAIRRALEIAQRGDVVLIAGKGHETYQEIHGARHPFDDRTAVREWLKETRR